MKYKAFYPQIFKLTLPIVVQNLLSVAVNSADVVMLSFVGQSSISAVSLASQYATVLFMVYYGLGTGATILCAQYYGKGDYQAIRIVEGISMRFSLVISTMIALAAFLFPEQMMKIFTNDTELISIGADYLRCMSVAYLCWGIIEVYLSILRSIGKVAISTGLNVMAFILNIPMSAIERRLFKKWQGKTVKAKRPVSLVMSIVFVLAILTLVVVAVVPQLRTTISTLGYKMDSEDI